MKARVGKCAWKCNLNDDILANEKGILYGIELINKNHSMFH